MSLNKILFALGLDYVGFFQQFSLITPDNASQEISRSKVSTKFTSSIKRFVWH